MFGNVDQFIKECLKYDDELKEELVLVAQSVSKKWYKNLTMRTPKDTGFARMNWSVSINEIPPSTTIDPPERRANYSDPKIPSFKNVEFGDKVYFFNNVSYIIDLEHGKSDQAPNGMLAVSIREAQEDLDNALRRL